VTADLVNRPPVPLVRALRALSPESKIILLGATATLDGAALITLHDQGIRGYFVWEEVRAGTVQRALLMVVEDEALVGSPIVLATLRAALERRRGARIDGLVLTPAQRATWTRLLADASPPLTPRQGEIAELMADGYTNAEIGQRLSISAETARDDTSITLTEKERLTLLGLARERTQQQIADDEGVSVRTIEDRVAALKHKFGVTTTFMLGVKAERAGFVPKASDSSQ